MLTTSIKKFLNGVARGPNPIRLYKGAAEKGFH
ncbi:MAG: hypothetical protein JWM44_484 [Bacilli bacterium]|nr:hypothetical protein [Bacilli bacterium]